MNGKREQPPARTVGTAIELDPRAARARQDDGGLLIDVRENDERAAGTAAGATGVPLAELEARIGALQADRARPVLLICASGQRSLHGARALRRLGYCAAVSVAGGFRRWQDEGLPVDAGTLDADSAARYLRQLQLPQVGIAGQARLAHARVVILGAGGLGSPAALYLAGAGVGHLTLIDDDRVERSNLQRQVLHTDADVGVAKVESARAALLALNPAIAVHARRARLGPDNVEKLLAGHDLLLDGSDNFPTRYLLCAASLRLRLPMIYGAVERFSGQLSVFDPRRTDSPCYRCLFPQPPAAADAPNCSEAGVLGVLPGMVGMLQATEALKLLLGIGAPLVGALLCFDALGMEFRKLHLARNPDCPGCGAGAVFTGYPDIERFCAGELE